MRFVEVRVYGRNFSLMRLAEIGELQPLQNLNQLTDLNLGNCTQLIGQSVSDFVREQPNSHAIGGNR